jgi:photosystem II stability/assembly factor-like uncharacterized protein
MTLNTGFLSLAVDPNDSNVVFTGSLDGVIRHYLDNGQWTFQRPLIDDCRNVRDLTFAPSNPEVLYASWRNFWGDSLPKISRSLDGGNNWETYVIDYELRTLAVHPSKGDVIFGGDRDFGVTRSLDHGQSWTPINNGIDAVMVRDVAIDPADPAHVLAGTTSGLYEKKEDGWSRLLPQDPREMRYDIFSIRFHPTDSRTFFVGLSRSYQYNFRKTTNGGTDWSFTSDLMGNDVVDIAIDQVDTDTLFVAAGKRIYKSTDGGITFVEVLHGQNLEGEEYRFEVVAIDPADHEHIFAGGGGFGYFGYLIGDLWESTAGGAKWSWKRTGLQNVVVNALLIDPRDSKIMYAGCGYKYRRSGTEVPVYKSTDGGASWTASYEGMPGSGNPWNPVTDLEFHRQNMNVVYASTLQQGVYVSPNQATNWLNLRSPKYKVHAISTSSLYAATEGGLWQCTGTGVIAGKIIDSLSRDGIHKATVFTDFGVKTKCIHGEYMMVHPAGVFNVTVVADDHANKTMPNVKVLGGDVTWADTVMQVGVADLSVVPRGVDGGGGGSGYG